MINRNLKIAVLTGGIGAERDVSILSGQCVAKALKDAGFNVVTADIQPDELEILRDSSIDVFFPALHGIFGEDGRLQEILEDRSLLFTGSGSTASKLAFDKMASKELFEAIGVAVPKAFEFHPDSNIERLREQLYQFADKYVVKPIREGSSVGIHIVSTPDDAVETAWKIYKRFGDCMIEEFIPGREVTVGILGNRTLPIIEIRTYNEFYDYHAKYVDEQTEFLFDTITNPSIAENLNQAAINCFSALSCRHFARVDFILSDEGIAYVLELNTIPGFTTHSLLPKAAARAGLPMSDLCTNIVEAASSSLMSRNV
jgi:D-alanine-D-alanine ligase